jgi:prepilin signal peptidase PulO-like enzyme (type II secretory pathway)
MTFVLINSAPSTSNRLPKEGFTMVDVRLNHPFRTFRSSLVALAVGGLLTAVYRGSPLIWLMPTTAAVSVFAAAVDLRERRVPNSVTGFGFLALIATLLVLNWTKAVGVASAFGGCALFAAPLLASNIVTKSHTPGLGDVKLAGTLGLTLGAVALSAAYGALVGALLLGGIGGALHKRITGERFFPLAPYISASTMAWLVIAHATKMGSLG